MRTVAIVLISSRQLRSWVLQVDVTLSLPEAPILCVSWSDPGFSMAWRPCVASVLRLRVGLLMWYALPTGCPPYPGLSSQRAGMYRQGTGTRSQGAGTYGPNGGIGRSGAAEKSA